MAKRNTEEETFWVDGCSDQRRPGMYILVGYLHDRDPTVPMTIGFVKNLVRRGMSKKDPTPDTLDEKFHKLCQERTEHGVEAKCCCIVGHKGSWVRWGPMEHDLFHCVKQKKELTGLVKEAHEQLCATTRETFLTVHVHVDVDGDRMVTKWTEETDQETWDRRESENKCPFQQTKIENFFQFTNGPLKRRKKWNKKWNKK